MCRSTILVKQAPISLVAPESNKVIQLKVVGRDAKRNKQEIGFQDTQYNATAGIYIYDQKTILIQDDLWIITTENNTTRLLHLLVLYT